MTETESPALGAYVPGPGETAALRYMNEVEPSTAQPHEHLIAREAGPWMFGVSADLRPDRCVERDQCEVPMTTLPDTTRLALTEAALASADRLWREEMRRSYGPDAVLTYGYAPEAQGGLGTPLRRSYEARRVAVALWRRDRHRAA